MEKEVRIRTKDGKTIYGLLRGDAKRPGYPRSAWGSLRRPLIVFVHGLTGAMDEHIYYNGVRFFERYGFSSLRFNLYDWRKGARKLHECTLQTHADDLDRVIEYARQHGAKKVFAVGHSYGGPTVLMSPQKRYDAIVLWDPTFWDVRIKRMLDFQNAKYVKSLKGYVEVWSLGVLLGKAMVTEARGMTAKGAEALIAKVQVPVKIIVTGKGVLIRGGKRYFSAANKPKAFAVIKGADHNFNFEGNAEALFKETLAWLKKWV